MYWTNLFTEMKTAIKFLYVYTKLCIKNTIRLPWLWIYCNDSSGQNAKWFIEPECCQLFQAAAAAGGEEEQKSANYYSPLPLPTLYTVLCARKCALYNYLSLFLRALFIIL